MARCAGRLLVGLLCGIVVVACDFRPSAPESRAEYFVEKLIREPQAVEELRSVARLAEGESPDALANDLPTRTTLTYLRARQRLGAKFGLHVAGTQRPTPDNRAVTVVVSEGTAVLNEGTAVRFQVELQKQEDAWLVTRLRSD
ncbi:MAG TPA: hypothetical protein VJ396_06465 [Acidiferrobacterales bacterium]|nr:hypothetical protein [Acidiferrobacterales bacterium]